jgi:hypothetical protein
MDLRRQNEAAESREPAEEEEVEEGEAEAEADTEAEADDEGDDGDEEGGKKKKKKPAKKKAAPKAKKPATKRVRTPKEVRQRAFWVVFDNSSKEVGAFAFNEKHNAEKLLEKKIQEKEGKATFYMNLVKREIKEEK